MSATAPPDRLERARRELAGRGYLTGPAATQPGARATTVRLALFAAALALLLAAAEVGSSGQRIGFLPPLAAGFLPAALVAVAGGYGLCRWLAVAALRLGGEPGTIASAVGVVAGAGPVAAVAAMGRPPVTGVTTLPAVVGAALAALGAALWMRHHLLVLLAFPAPPAAGRRVTGAIFPVVVLGGVVAVLALAHRSDQPETAAGASFPPPQGRVAIVAVDGLAREELEAAADLVGTDALRDLTLWGWAAVAPPRPQLPVVFWTTVACGVPPPLHGITVLEEVRLFGMEEGVPLSRVGRLAVATPLQWFGAARVLARPATVRRRATMWEMASRAGAAVTVGGWWGSWPVRRVMGEIVSERAWLGGDCGRDAVTPGLAALVEAAWQGGSADAAAASDALAVRLVETAGGVYPAHLLALSLPALDIERRRAPAATPFALVQRQLPHLAVVDTVVAGLRSRGYRVWLVGAPWHGGTAFVASSVAPSGRYEPVAAEELAGTVLDQMGLPSPLGLPPPRRDLSRVTGLPGVAQAYGPPPPPLAAPSARSQQVQRDVLRNLGYLQ